MSRYSAAWLHEELRKTLGWDEFVADGVVDAVVNAQARSDVLDIIQNFMGNDPKGANLINKYLEERDRGQKAGPSRGHPGPPGQSGQTSQTSRPREQQTPVAPLQPHQAPALGEGWRVYRKGDDADSNTYATTTASSKSKSKTRQSSRPSSTQDLTALVSEAPAGAPSTSTSTQQDDAVDTGVGKALGMFKKGGRIRAPKAAGQPARRDEQLVAAAVQLEKKVVNCLGCGKIFDCRTIEGEISRFLESGGICTFCGDAVPLTYNVPPPESYGDGEASGSGGGGPSGGSGGAVDESSRAAFELKDRLVGYDRDAARRTQVIDDQSDYFEIDSNAWLNDEERQEMRERRRVAEEAEAARKQRVTVTLDLLGRRVLVDEGGGGDTGFTLSSEAGAAAVAGLAAEGGSGEVERERAWSGSGAALKEEMKIVSAAQLRAQLAREAAALKELRISANPNIPTPPPVFLPSTARHPPPAAAPALPPGLSHAGGRGAGGRGRGGKEQVPPAGGRRPAARPKLNRRVQDDNVFDAFEEDLMCEEVAHMALGD